MNKIEPRFQESIKKIKKLVEIFRGENESEINEVSKKWTFYKRNYMYDNCLVTEKPGSVAIQVTLFNSDRLVDNLVKVLKCVPPPFNIKLDCGVTMNRPDMGLFSYIPLPYCPSLVNQSIIKDLGDAQRFMNELGWEFQTNGERDDSQFIKLIQEKHDSAYGYYSRSKFSLSRIYYIELYINAEQKLLNEWTNVN